MNFDLTKIFVSHNCPADYGCIHWPLKGIRVLRSSPFLIPFPLPFPSVSHSAFTMASFDWESTIVDPFTSLDNSTLIPLFQDSYPPQSNPKPKDSLDVATTNGATANSVSPPYSDSSPSPSSANEDGVSLNDSRPNGDTNHKRRASPDNIEIDEQQSASKSPTTQDGKLRRTVAPSRRKSGGERGHVSTLAFDIILPWLESSSHLAHIRTNRSFSSAKSKTARRNVPSEKGKRSTSKM